MEMRIDYNKRLSVNDVIELIAVSKCINCERFNDIRNDTPDARGIYIPLCRECRAIFLDDYMKKTLKEIRREINKKEKLKSQLNPNRRLKNEK